MAIFNDGAGELNGLAAGVEYVVGSAGWLEATLDGFEVMPMIEAARIGDIFVTVTGDINVISTSCFRAMKDGAIVANSGHFNVEIDLASLTKLSKKRRMIRDFVEEFTIGAGKRGPITERLQNLFFGLFDGSTADRWGWLEPIVEPKSGRIERPVAV